MVRGKKERGQADSPPLPSSVLFSRSPSLFPSYPTFAKYLYAPSLGLGAGDTEMNLTQFLPSRSSWSQGPADKGKTTNRERWEPGRPPASAQGKQGQGPGKQGPAGMKELGPWNGVAGEGGVTRSQALPGWQWGH